LASLSVIGWLQVASIFSDIGYPRLYPARAYHGERYVAEMLLGLDAPLAGAFFSGSVDRLILFRPPLKAICEMFDPPDMTVSDVIEVAPTRVRQLLAKFPGLSKEQFSRCMEMIFSTQRRMTTFPGIE
jgi:hypothetical protein